MFKRYNLKLNEKILKEKFYVNSGSITSYKNKFENNQTELFEKVRKRFIDETILDGTDMSNEWFPSGKWDVFISHSHNDKNLAIHLAAWINRKFNLNVFIDSFVWGSADELLKIIDDEYCVLKEKDGKVTYNYNKRNLSTSHVHMMLSGALSDVIYNTECIIFLNTPKSVTLYDLNKPKTNSPWIYNEIKISSMMETKYPRKKTLSKYTNAHEAKMNQKIKRSIEVEYDVEDDLKKFKDITFEDLLLWEKSYNQNKDYKIHALDYLYFKI